MHALAAEIIESLGAPEADHPDDWKVARSCAQTFS